MGDFAILAKRIKELRTSLNLTQKQFAEIVGCTSATLSAYENGAKSPSLEIVKGIAEKCGVSIDWLCGLSDEKNSHKNIETYSDVLELLFEISEVLPFDLPDDYTGNVIHFKSFVFRRYLEDLRKYQDLLHTKMIDDDIFQACIKKLLRESNRKIDSSDAQGGFMINMDELPFK